ncbi:MAG: hypothetical protein R3F37_07355 [Candidatus Competibacteraceae bacterium]
MRKVARLPPAQAMRPEPLARYRQTCGRMAASATAVVTAGADDSASARTPNCSKALLSIIGIAFACAMLVVGSPPGRRHRLHGHRAISAPSASGTT